LFLFNLEYRFPIAGAFGGTVFYDAGNVWADWRSIDWGEVKQGIGVGVRYLSPIGPLRLDAGWKLDPDEGESRGPVLLISFGNPF
jgi:outer membrane protein insertion porin family